MNMICPSLRSQIICHEFYDMVWHYDEFSFDQRCLDETMQVLKVEFTAPGFNATTQNKLNTLIYFIAKGVIEVTKTLEGTEQLYVDTIKSGAMFGEVSAIMGSRA